MMFFWLKERLFMKKEKVAKMENVNKPKFKPAGTGDFKTPAKTPWGALLRLPLPIVVPAATPATGEPGRVRIRFGLACNHPLIVWSHTNVRDYGLEYNATPTVLPPGEEAVLILENKTTRPVEIMDGTALLEAVVLASSDFDVER
jgi:hypothetical protein